MGRCRGGISLKRFDKKNVAQNLDQSSPLNIGRIVLLLKKHFSQIQCFQNKYLNLSNFPFSANFGTNRRDKDLHYEDS